MLISPSKPALEAAYTDVPLEPLVAKRLDMLMMQPWAFFFIMDLMACRLPVTAE
jgi:hypothetical protein